MEIRVKRRDRFFFFLRNGNAATADSSHAFSSPAVLRNATTLPKLWPDSFSLVRHPWRRLTLKSERSLIRRVNFPSFPPHCQELAASFLAMAYLEIASHDGRFCSFLSNSNGVLSHDIFSSCSLNDLWRFGIWSSAGSRSGCGNHVKLSLTCGDT